MCCFASRLGVPGVPCAGAEPAGCPAPATWAFWADWLATELADLRSCYSHIQKSHRQSVQRILKPRLGLTYL